MSDGREVFLAFRKEGDLYRQREKTASDAIAAGKAAWAIDYETLTTVRLQNITLVGVLVKDTNDIYLSTMAAYQDRTKSSRVNMRGEHIILPFEFFAKMAGGARAH